MTTDLGFAQAIDLTKPEYYFNRELSWLEFNNRVLQEGFDERTPLIERLKFLAIFSNNLDEFFMVRVAGLKKQVGAQVAKRTADGLTPQQQLEAIATRLHPLVTQQHHHFYHHLRHKLADLGVHVLDYVDLNQVQRSYLQDYFEKQIFPTLTPLAVDPAHPFPFISNLSLNLAVVIKNEKAGEENFARVKVPENLFSRFVQLPEPLHQGVVDGIDSAQLWAQLWVGVPIEQVVAHNLEYLFPGMKIQECYPFRVTRNADLNVEEDEADDLLLAIEQELRKRRFGGSVVRLEVQSIMPENVRSLLMQKLEISDADVYTVDGILGLGDLFSFMKLPLPEYKDRPWSATLHPRMKRLNTASKGSDLAINPEDFFASIQHQDLLLHHPYQSFTTSVQQFITLAAHDDNVLAIKMTLYRTSGDSPILKALIDAAENGKQVAVLVELKARFDEENNIQWARLLEQAGIHVVYGLVGYKTHTKTALVVRREAQGIRRYVHIGTGNYNPKTANLYTDLGLITCREELGADLTDLFNNLTGYSSQQSYRKLLVAPTTLRPRMVQMIQRETDHARQGDHSRIVAKMNSLVDPEIIQALYTAAQAGVKIDLIIRGICCLRPGVAGVSENIQVISIIGRFLEHSRIFYFHNDGDEEIYIGSADWMPRNLDRRVEAVTPIENPDLKKELQELLGIMLADNRQAWELDVDGNYKQRQPVNGAPEKATHQVLMDLYSD